MPPKRTVTIPSQQQPLQQQQQNQSKKINDDDTKELQDETFKVNDWAMNKNKKLLQNIRTYGALNSGILAGLFGMSGGIGFIFYFLFFFLVSGVILYKGKFQLHKYFINSSDALVGGIGEDLTLFLMIWVITHNLVNIL
ncbi:hypothetical protein PPERSA_03193 [Pseudocohnilembus persalinus]|uniref:ER membrane protein complex subunit 6 n=1 Tax=Pseudocohnilembus persalinus TaxID=266149 RepID=A0A0V0QE27_PSEPJ|nr:hypothetical protein PPERSA_03193 [Pseudocohnilembus persalinus]|eukprot:KRX00460.1 hypothetical protein PPERSA_03193 [Pseudocohnilembus persalinus]